MATTIKSLKIGNSSEYQFIGKTWYGTCSTSGTDQTKNANISGFTSADCVAGTRVIVKFSSAQLYNGTPRLSVNGIAQAYITYGNGFAEYYEWNSGAVVAFVYDGTHWVIEDGGHASTSVFGKTLLTNTVSSLSSVALTPYALQNSIREILDNQYQGNDSEITVLLDTTTPSAEAWTDDSVQYNDIATLANLNANYSSNRIIKVTYGDIVSYHQLYWNTQDNAYSWAIYYVSEMDSVSVLLDTSDSRITIHATSTHQGVYPFKVELYEQEAAGFVSYPIFKDTVGDIETLLASI